ncbi:MAG: ComEC/Rec2 family competence protein, partial [Actinomycetota bacterium]
MGAWTLPAAAVAFALGLLGSGAVPGWLEPWMALAVGLVLLGAGWLAAGHERRGPGALARAGLVALDHEVVEAVGGRRVVPFVTPVVAAAVSLVGVLTLGAGWGAFHDRALDGALLADLAPERVVLTGTFKTDPKESTLGWSAVAQVRRVEWPDGAATLRSSIWVSGSEEVPMARRGDRVRLEGTLRVPDDAGFAEALRHKGIPAQLQLQTLTRLGPSSSAFIRATQSVRRIVGRSIERVFPRKEAGLLLGLLLGDDSQLDAGLERDFRASGLSHLLVVSGGNVAMVLAPVLAATTLLRLPRWPKFAVGFGAVAFFTVLTGAEPSVLRAGVMACLALVGMLAGRPRTTASILSAAVLGLLVLDPWLVRSVGFQLSVTATAGMVALASPLAERFDRLMPAPLAAAAGATVSAQLGVTPVLLYHFHEVPLATLPANLAAFPLVAPSLLLGAVAAGTGLVWFPLGRLVGALALLPMRWLEFVADHLGKAPVGYLTADGGPLVLVGGTALVAAIVVWVRTGWKPSRPLIAAAIASMPFLVWASA